MKYKILKFTISISLLLFLSFFAASTCLAVTKTFYYRNDTHTVNGLNAYRLGITNTAGSYRYIEYGAGWNPQGQAPIPPAPGYYNTDVYIRHANGTETLLGSRVAEVTRYNGGTAGGYQAASWSCPETNLSKTDAIKVVERVRCNFPNRRSPYDGERTRNFITDQLGVTKLNASNWTFYRWTWYRGDGGCMNGYEPCGCDVRTYYGDTSHATRIEGISYTVAPSVVTGFPTVTKNIIPESWVSKKESRTSEYASDSSVSGSVANTYDENMNTYRQWYVHHGGDGRASATLIITDTWASPRHIDKIRTKAWGESYAGNYLGWKIEFNTYLLIGGTWTQVDRGAWARHSETRWPGYNEGPINVDTNGSWGHHKVALYDRTIQSQSGWNNVTGMRVRVYSGGYSYEGDRQQRLWTRIYEMQAFATEPTTTKAATNITSDSAALNGNITNTGGKNVDQRGFEWGLNTNYGNSWVESGSFGTGGFSHTISGLKAGTTYHFRAKAHNSAGWGYGKDATFTTPSVVYTDCGLRAYDGTKVITIACEPTGTLTSPLRIRKGSTTYGIVLVDTTDSNASKIRIKTSSGIKALRKL